MSKLELIRVLSQGGMGEVFEAILISEDGIQKKVAAKKVLEDRPESEILEEAKKSINLEHKNLVKTFQLLRHDSSLYLIQEYLDGYTLQKLFEITRESNVKVSFDILASILLQALEGIKYLQNKGIAHRDLSPSNVIITRDGLLKILDFGIASELSQTLHDSIKGKIAYLSAEALEGKVSLHNDIYSLGLIIYELAVSQRIYSSASYSQTLKAKKSFNLKSLNKIRDDLPATFTSLIDEIIRNYRDTQVDHLLEKVRKIFPQDTSKALTDIYNLQNTGGQSVTITDRKLNVFISKHRNWIKYFVVGLLFLTAVAIISFLATGIQKQTELYIQKGSKIRAVKIPDKSYTGVEKITPGSFSFPACASLCLDDIIPFDGFHKYSSSPILKNAFKTFKDYADAMPAYLLGQNSQINFVMGKCEQSKTCNEIQSLRSTLSDKLISLLNSQQYKKLQKGIFNYEKYLPDLIASYKENETFIKRYVLNSSDIKQYKVYDFSLIRRHNLIEVNSGFEIKGDLDCRVIAEMMLVKEYKNRWNLISEKEMSYLIVKSNQVTNVEGDFDSSTVQIFNRNVDEVDLCLVDFSHGYLKRVVYIYESL